MLNSTQFILNKANFLTLCIFLLIGTTTAQSSDTLEGLADIVSQMIPGEWYEIPNSSIQQVFLTQAEAVAISPYIWGYGPRNIVQAWGGAAFDGRKMYFHGGGHKSYGGNEVYNFDFKTLTWTRMTEPSAITSNCPSSTPDNTPVAVHTYDGIIWTPKTSTIFRFQGALYCTYGVNTDQVWEFNPTTKSWTKHQGVPSGPGIPHTALDPVTGNIIIGSKNGTFEFDPVTGVYSRQSNNTYGAEGNFAVDPTRRLIVSLHSGSIKKFSLDANPLGSPIDVAISGDLVLDQSTRQYGISYSTANDVFVLWHAGREIYTLDIATGTVMLYNNSTGTAPTPDVTRIYSKWIYIPQYDVFAGYATSNEGMWLYKLPASASVAIKNANGKNNHLILNAHPNPFNPKTTIRFQGTGPSEIRIYDLNGHLIRNWNTRASVVWNGKDLYGKDVASGTYIVRVIVGERVISKRIVLMR